MSFARHNLLLAGLVGLMGCASADPEPPAPSEFVVPAGFPAPPIPANNPWTEAKFQLGRHLFYDPQLSANQQQACAGCHVQALAFADGKPQAIGSTGEVHPRNSQTLVNIAWNSTLTWGHPTLTLLENQLPGPIFGTQPVELGVVDKASVLQRFVQDPRYQNLIADAYGTAPFGWDELIGALATFVRGLTSANSPYDRYVAGDKTALPAAAKRGMDLFFSEELECHHCHGGFNFSDATISAKSAFGAKLFQNNGLYNLAGSGAYPPRNGGIFEHTGNPDDMGRFRPPTLRNIIVSAPYMHDGSIATLGEVIDHYARGGRLLTDGPYAGDGAKSPYKSGLVGGFELTSQQKFDLLAFLYCLTDDEFLTTPRFASPFAPTQP
jgi:cytochrome c peroxidase